MIAYSRIISAFLVLLLGLCGFSVSAQQAPSEANIVNKVVYDCPHLQDENRRTIAALTQGNEGWFFRQSDINEYFALLPHAKNYLTRLTKAFANQGTKLILLQVPPRPFSGYKYFNRTQPGQRSFNRADGMVYYNSYIKDLESTGAMVVDLTDKMEEYDPETKLHFFYKRDTHWTPFGSRLSAQRVAEKLKQDKVYQSIKPTSYKTEITGELQMKSAIAMEAETLCTDKVPSESFPSYHTNAQIEKGEDALFGDISSASPLILLGSSFSAVPWFNFDGFLSQYTGLEVANFAISAGKLFNAIVSYTSMPKENRLDPNFVVWENLAHYDFNLGDAMFRQAIPAVYGECSPANAIKAATITIKQEQEESDLFALDVSKKINGSDYYLYLNSDNESLSNFTVEMEYSDGDGEWFIIDRRENFNNSGRFFVELSDEINSNLKTIRLIGLPSIAAKIEARLCKIPNKP